MKSRAKIILSIAAVAAVILIAIQIAILANRPEPPVQATPQQNSTTQLQGQQYNVIIFAFDGLQARHLREYGYERNHTPNLDRFLNDSYVFRRTISPASWTVPAFTSIMTSMYPSEHGVVNKFIVYDLEKKQTVRANLKELSPEAVTLAEVLQKNGYATGGFTGDAGVSKPFGFGEGFDTYWDGTMFGGFNESSPRALEWLREHKDEQFFLFVHGYDVHGQHEPEDGFDYRFVQKPYRGNYTGSKIEQGLLREAGLLQGALNLSEEDVAFWQAIYDEKIAKADEDFGAFMAEVDALGLRNNTIIIVISDHGTEFYEHKRVDHGHTLYGELVETLFAVHIPNQQGGKIESLVSTLDVMPTTLSLLGLEEQIPATAKGIDLTPALAGRDVSRPIFTETDYRLYTHKRAVQTPDGWKLILTLPEGELELYNMTVDRQERFNLAQEQPALAYELEQSVRRHMREMNDTGPWLYGCSPVYNDQCTSPTLAAATSNLTPNASGRERIR